MRHLKHSGFSEEDLVKVYVSMIRPVAEYMLEVFHSMLSDAQDEALERLQTHALKCIFGPGLSGRRMRDMAGVQTLRERRIEQCDKFAIRDLSIGFLKKREGEEQDQVKNIRRPMPDVTDFTTHLSSI